jgi:hypothetical protein
MQIRNTLNKNYKIIYIVRDDGESSENRVKWMIRMDVYLLTPIRAKIPVSKNKGSQTAEKVKQGKKTKTRDAECVINKKRERQD